MRLEGVWLVPTSMNSKVSSGAKEGVASGHGCGCVSASFFRNPCLLSLRASHGPPDNSLTLHIRSATRDDAVELQVVMNCALAVMSDIVTILSNTASSTTASVYYVYGRVPSAVRYCTCTVY